MRYCSTRAPSKPLQSQEQEQQLEQEQEPEQDQEPPLPPNGGHEKGRRPSSSPFTELGQARFEKAFGQNISCKTKAWAELFEHLGENGQEFFDHWINIETLRAARDYAIKKKLLFAPGTFRLWLWEAQQAEQTATLKAVKQKEAADATKLSQQQLADQQADAADCHKAWNALSEEDKTAIIEAGRGALGNPNAPIGAIRAMWWETKKFAAQNKIIPSNTS